jgi:hypothetical protein
MQADLMAKVGFHKEARKIAELCNVEMMRYDQPDDVGEDQEQNKERHATKELWMTAVMGLYPILFRPIRPQSLPPLIRSNTSC